MGKLYDFVSPGCHIYCIEHLLSGLILCPVKCIHNRLETVKQRAEDLVGQRLIILNQVKAAECRLIGDLCRILRI